MINVNKITLVGNLGTKPEDLNGGNGCKFSLATNKSWKDKQDEWQTKTTWHNVSIWGDQGTRLLDKMNVGDLVYLEGEVDVTVKEVEGKKTYYHGVKAYKVQYLPKEKVATSAPTLDGNDQVPF